MTTNAAHPTLPTSPGWLGPGARPPFLKRVWRALPAPTRRKFISSCTWTGLPFLVNYASSYGRMHTPELFAGTLPSLFEEYAAASSSRRAELLARFDAIADAIVLPNGVRKTTYASRATALLRRILADPACELPARPLRVLDLPASTGVASLGAHQLIASLRPVREFVLADLAFHLLFDRGRGCVFDADRNLLQVRTSDGFISTALPHAEGCEVNALTRLLLAPHLWRGERLRQAIRASDAKVLDTLTLLRPDVLDRCRAGEFTIRALDVFAPLSGSFDLILSFNLLQRNYFAPEMIARGRENLAAALAPGGLLVLGSPDAGGIEPHRVYRRTERGLVVVRAEGEV